MTGRPERWVEIGRVGRPHGVRGELRLFVDNPDTELLVPGASFELRRERRRGAFSMRAARRGRASWIVALDGLEDRNAAAAWTHATVWTRRSDLPDLEDDELYLGDLVGAEVRDADSGARLGEVGRLGFSNVEVLEIVLDDGAVALVPLIEAYVTAIAADHVAVRNLHHWLP